MKLEKRITVPDFAIKTKSLSLFLLRKENYPRYDFFFFSFLFFFFFLKKMNGNSHENPKPKKFKHYSFIYFFRSSRFSLPVFSVEGWETHTVFEPVDAQFLLVHSFEARKRRFFFYFLFYLLLSILIRFVSFALFRLAAPSPSLHHFRLSHCFEKTFRCL